MSKQVKMKNKKKKGEDFSKVPKVDKEEDEELEEELVGDEESDEGFSSLEEEEY